MAAGYRLYVGIAVYRQFCGAFYIGTRVNATGTDFVWPFKLFIAVGLVNYIYKFIIAILLTPVIYIVHNIIEKYLGHDKAAEMKAAAMSDK